jgi:ferredoxin--NADP+ reductase
MLEDLAADRTLLPENTDPAALSKLVSERQPDSFSYEDWKRLDKLEVGRGESEGKPRVKFTSVQEMLANLERDQS